MHTIGCDQAMTYTQRSETQLATKGFGSMFSWQDRNGKKRRALHFSMASCRFAKNEKVGIHTFEKKKT